MKKRSINSRKVYLTLILLPLIMAFGYVIVRSGPLAPIPVTVTQVKNEAITPALFGLGTVEARYSYRIGPSTTGHVLRLDVQVGDSVRAGQLLGDMDPVDMDNRVAAKEAAIKRARAALIASEARVTDAIARERYAQSQSQRYQALAKEHTVSSEQAEAKYQEYQITRAGTAAARANHAAAEEELAMLLAELQGLQQQRNNLQLIAPVDGLVVGRYAEPGSTVVAGQTVLEVIDPDSTWVNVRFDQLQAKGLATGLPTSIVLRSRPGQAYSGHLARLEPLADAVTEELLAKVAFELLPQPLPPIGELAEVTVTMPQLDSAPVVPNASIKQVNGKPGVWLVDDGQLRYVPVELGAADLDGRVQVLHGLTPGDSLVLYSAQELTPGSRITIVEQLVDGAR